MSDINHQNAERLAAMLHAIAQATPEDAEPVVIDTLDGYMTALICGPQPLTPVHAMDALFGELWAEVLDEQDATEEFMSVLHERWNEIAESLDPEALAADPEAMLLQPLITEFDEDSKAELVRQGAISEDQLDELPPSGVMWVLGFMQAVEDHADSWEVFDEGTELGDTLDAMLSSVAAPTLPPGDEREAFIEDSYDADEEVDQNVLVDDALFSVQDLRLFWAQMAVTQQIEAAIRLN